MIDSPEGGASFYPGSSASSLSWNSFSDSSGLTGLVSGAAKKLAEIQKYRQDNDLINPGSAMAREKALSQGVGADLLPTTGGAQAVEVSQSPEYIYADLAKHYGLDASTAYQEALANTSYQRAVKDLQAAGLNPLLAATNLGGASGVAHPMLNGSGVTYSSGISAASGLRKAGFTALGTVLGMVLGKSPSSAYYGGRAGSLIADVVDGLAK